MWKFVACFFGFHDFPVLRDMSPGCHVDVFCLRCGRRKHSNIFPDGPRYGTNDNPEPCRCDGCGDVFQSEDNLRRHIHDSKECYRQYMIWQSDANMG